MCNKKRPIKFICGNQPYSVDTYLGKLVYLRVANHEQPGETKV